MNLAQTSRPLTSVSLKVAMAATGLFMAGWLTLHMLGNLLVFAGPEVMNGYALKLRATGLLWPLRTLLLAAFAAHVLAAFETSRRSWRARPERYRLRLRCQAASFASRTMRAGGVLLLAYIIYHVAHIYGAGHATFIPGDVHHNLISGLRQPLHAALYMIATAGVCLHLAHGLQSSLRSLGLFEPARERLIARVTAGWAWLVTLGFALPILAALASRSPLQGDTRPDAGAASPAAGSGGAASLAPNEHALARAAAAPGMR